MKSGKKNKLPKPDDLLHLSDFGYAVSKNKISRQTSLKKASKKNGSLRVLRRLNLIRNLTSVEKNKNKMTKDIDFLKKEYKKEKKNNL